MPYKTKEEWREYNKRRNARNAADLQELKSKPCTDCNKTFPHYVMEFDHVPERGKKLKDIGKMTNRSINAPTFKAELAKCDLVCANCHKIRTYERGQQVKRGELLFKRLS
tara:strand:- start:930 stop:1259 length:330 start_codon:yes stop_codon:yes gene_type:complete